MKTISELVVESMKNLQTERPCARCGNPARSAAREPVCAKCSAADHAARWEGATQRTLAEVARGLPFRYRAASFEDGNLARMGDMLHMYPERLEGIRGSLLSKSAKSSALFFGGAGTGKTTLACATLMSIARKIIGPPDPDEEPGRTGGFERASQCAYVRALTLTHARLQHGAGQGEAPAVLLAMHAPVLVLDDLGLEPTSSTIIEVLAERLDNESPTIITTSLSSGIDGPTGPNTILGRYGEGVARRIYETMPIVNLDGIRRERAS